MSTTLTAIAEAARAVCDLPGPEAERVRALCWKAKDEVDTLRAELKRIADQGPLERYGANGPEHQLRWVVETRTSARALLEAVR